MNTALLFATMLFADGPWQLGPWHYLTFEPSISVSANGAGGMHVLLPVPHDDTHQQLFDLYELPKSVRRTDWRDAHNLNGWLDLELGCQAGEEHTVSAKMVVMTREYKLDPMFALPEKDWVLSKNEQRSLQNYLRESPSVGSASSQVWSAGKRMIFPSKNPLDMARRIYDATLAHFTYERKNQFKGAEQAYADQVGECCDYVAVFVAWCRSQGIPARSVNGVWLSNNGWDRHVWAEFYVRKLGWVPCDPSNGDNGSPQSEDRHFGRVSPGYLALTRDFDLELNKPEIKPEHARLVQQYLYYYEIKVNPKLTYDLSGELIGTDPPKRRGKQLPRKLKRSEFSP